MHLLSTPDLVEGALSGERSPLAFRDELPPPPLPSTATSGASPSLSNRGDYRISAIPTHPSITEVPEESTDGPAPVPILCLPDDEERLTSSDRGHTPVPVAESLVDALKAGLGKSYLRNESPRSEAASQLTSASTQVRRAVDDSNRQTLLAYWQRSEADRTLHASSPAQRRHSWNSSRPESTDGEGAIARSASPYRTVAGRWTSQWEDRRGLGISEDFTPRPSTDGQQHFTWSSSENSPQGSERRLEGRSALPPSPGKVRRKPVPEGHTDGMFASSSQQPIQPHIVFPVTVDETVGDGSKRSSHASRASATTDALHSHVENIRAGPRYQIDRSASSLLFVSSPDTTHVSVESTPDSPAGKRPRALSLMAKIKGRVRKNSDTTTISSPYTASPSTPGYSFGTAPHTPLTPAKLGTEGGMMSSESTIEQAHQPPQPAAARSLYARARRPSKKSTLDVGTLEAQLMATAAAKRAARGTSISRRSSRHSLRSSHSNRSIRSKRSSTPSMRELDLTPPATMDTRSTKHRSNSQPLPAQQQWWKGHVVWPRRGSAAGVLDGKADAADEQAGWVGDDEALPEDDRGIMAPVAQAYSTSEPKGRYAWNAESVTRSAVSPTGTELLAQEEDLQGKRNQPGRTESPPLAFIGRASEQTTAHPQHGQYSYSAMTASSSSTSTFSSLAPPPAPAPVPPPRPSRKTKRRDSSSNGGDSSSPTSPLFPSKDSDEQGARTTRTAGSSPLSFCGDVDQTMLAGMAAFVPAISTPDSAYHSLGSGTKEVLLSDDSQEHLEPSEVDQGLQGDESDIHATMQPYLTGVGAVVARRMRLATLSPVEEMRKQENGRLQEEDEEDEDGGTVIEAGRHRRTPSQSGAFMGLPSASPHKRPLPAPPALAEPRTDVLSVERSNSIGSSHAGSTMPSIASMKKHTSGEAGLETKRTMQRRPLPPTPTHGGLLNRPNRSFSMPSKPTFPPHTRATHEVVQAADAHPQPSGGAGGVRQSWTSADGSWHADVVTLPDNARAQPPSRGLARAFVAPNGRLLRQRSSSSPMHTQLAREGELIQAGEGSGSGPVEARQRSPEETTTSFEPVPFAETAVQASLAALAALEQSEQGNDWQSRWARDKLMGASTMNSSSTKVPLIRLEPSLSELSDYSNSRTRRRAVPYSRSREDNSSSADERTRRSARKKQSQAHPPMTSSSASVLGNMTGATSDSDLATSRRHDSTRKASGSSRRTAGASNTETVSHNKQRRGRIPSFSQQHSGVGRQGKEDWDEKIVPALAKRLQVEAEQEAKMLGVPTHTLQRQESGLIEPLLLTPDADSMRNEGHRKGRRTGGSESRRKPSKATANESDDGKTSRSRHTRHASDKDKRKQQSSSSVNRLPKVRKGYGCDDIKAWQASLGVAAPPTALVE